MGRQAAGVRAMSLGKKDEVIGMVAIGARGQIHLHRERERLRQEDRDRAFTAGTRRGGKGIINLKVTPKIGNALAVLGVGDEDLLVVTVSGKVIRIQTKQVRASGRATQGVRLINLDENDRVCSVAVAREESE